MQPALPLTAELPSVSLSDLDSTWATTRRYDTKFILNREVMDKFLRRTNTNFAVLEVADARAFTYETSYFDTPDLLLYRDHAQRRRRRIKVRTRRYVESARTRLEIKARLGNGQTQKALFEDCHGIGSNEIRLVNDAILNLNYSDRLFDIADRLQPTAVTNFQRSTIINKDEIERITLDSGLILNAHSKSIHMQPDFVLVEIKSPHRMSQTVRQLRQSGIHPTSFSKYCAAIEVTQEIRPRIHSAEKLARILSIVES